MKHRSRMKMASILLLAVVGLHANKSFSQDSFGGARPAPGSGMPSPSQQPVQPPVNTPTYGNPPVSGRSAPTTNNDEGRDFGVAPQKELKPSDQLHGPTPTRIPGGLVITTQALAQLLQNKQSGALVLHVYGAPTMLPDAKTAAPASAGGSFNDSTQQGFGQYLQQITGGDKSRPLVTYCEGVQCWMSYNAALRAINMGYSNVLWYRGGLEAWRQAGLPLQQPNQPNPR